MIKNVNIHSFRGITNLYLENLSNINILVGNNNCGKTSVLEALLLLNKPYSFANVISTAIRRDGRFRPINRSSLSNYDAFKYLFNKLNDYNEIGISAKIGHSNIDWELCGKINKTLLDYSSLDMYESSKINRHEMIEDEIEEFKGSLQCLISDDSFRLPRSQRIKFNKYSRISRHEPFEQNLINMHYISSSDYLLDTSFRSIIKDSSITNQVIKLLNIFDEDIVNLKIIETDERRFLQVVEHKTLGIMPINLYGDGFKKVITLANAIVQSKNGVLLIDEIETGIHVSAMKNVFSWLVNACYEFNVQLFITTHSLETLDQFLLCHPNIIGNDLVRVITLLKKHSNTIARNLPGDKALRVRNNYDMELR